MVTLLFSPAMPTIILHLTTVVGQNIRNQYCSICHTYPEGEGQLPLVFITLTSAALANQMIDWVNNHHPKLHPHLANSAAIEHRPIHLPGAILTTHTLHKLCQAQSIVFGYTFTTDHPQLTHEPDWAVLHGSTATLESITQGLKAARLKWNPMPP